jgi:hypothetical protein
MRRRVLSLTLTLTLLLSARHSGALFGIVDREDCVACLVQRARIAQEQHAQPVRPAPYQRLKDRNDAEACLAFLPQISPETQAQAQTALETCLQQKGVL